MLIKNRHCVVAIRGEDKWLIEIQKILLRFSQNPNKRSKEL